MTEETGITLQQEDETIEEIDCLWLMWDNLDWQENLRSPSTPKRRAQNIPRFPPIDCRPLVARNQFVSQSRLENMVGIMKQNSPSSSFVQKSNCLVEEKIHEISSAIHGKTIDEILPSPREADFVDSRGPSAILRDSVEVVRYDGKGEGKGDQRIFVVRILAEFFGSAPYFNDRQS